MRRLWLVALVPVITACPVGPNFKVPETAVPAQWRDSTISTQDSSYANLPWWQVLGDTTLRELVRSALRENRDLRIALARVNEARAQLGIRRLELLPQINVGATLGTVNVNDSLLGLRQGQYGFYELSGSISWEIDLFGRLRRLNESAKASLLATEYARRGAIMTVVADVARVYLELRDLDQQTVIAQSTVETRRQSLDLARSRFEGGLTSELDMRQGESELARAEGRVANVRLQAAVTEQNLSFILGRMPGTIPRGAALINQQFRTEIPPGLPSGLLTRRPDVREAEQQLRAANAMIGAAIAARFPTISLTAAGGTRSDAIENLFKAGTGFWHLATNVLLPIINAGRSGKQVAMERARTEGAVARYDAVVLNAFREVENGLVSLEQLQIQAAAATRQVAAARRAVVIAGDRYQGGVDSYTTLLDAQRVLADAELNESSLQRQQRVAVVQLYRALGGGWDPQTDSLSLTPPAK